VTSLFAAFDALCEEGTATTVCRALDEVADISIPGNLSNALSPIVMLSTSQLIFPYVCFLSTLRKVKGYSKDQSDCVDNSITHHTLGA
jgi:hypothetical protein